MPVPFPFPSSESSTQYRRHALSDISLQDCQPASPPSEASGAQPEDPANHQTQPKPEPLVLMEEKVPPPAIVVIGSAIDTAVVQLDLDGNVFSNCFKTSLSMEVALLLYNSTSNSSTEIESASDSLLVGPTIVRSEPCVEDGAVRYTFCTDSLRVTQEGRYYLSYCVVYPGPHGN